MLTAERAEQDQARRKRIAAGRLLGSMLNETSGNGLVPEQVWDAPDVPKSPYGTDPTVASIGFTNGKPAGSTSPLTWGSASLVRLVADLGAGRSVETPDVTTKRYVTHHQRGTRLTLATPADQSAVTAPTVPVSGTAAPHATVDVADVGTDQNSTTTVSTTTANGSGAWQVNVPTQDGTNVLVVAATAPGGGTAQAVRTVVKDVVHGTKLLDVTDPTGDDNGPGNYAYPTAPDFHAGAYDLTDFQVYDTGSTVTFRVQTRDLTPTFGSPLGAQLVDVYVHEPGARTDVHRARPTSAATTRSPRGRVEPAARGAGLRPALRRRRAGATVGTIAISANQISRYITFTVNKSDLGGTPTTGWKFTVTLAGQDGYSADKARAFTSTPSDYTFGECATASTDAHCTVPDEHAAQGHGHHRPGRGHPVRRAGLRRARSGGAAGRRDLSVTSRVGRPDRHRPPRQGRWARQREHIGSVGLTARPSKLGRLTAALTTFGGSRAGWLTRHRRSRPSSCWNRSARPSSLPT